MNIPASVHLYFLSDQFQGYLVRHQATNRASTQLETLETWVSSKDHFTLPSPPPPSNRLQHVQVRPLVPVPLEQVKYIHLNLGFSLS